MPRCTGIKARCNLIHLIDAIFALLAAAPPTLRSEKESAPIINTRIYGNPPPLETNPELACRESSETFLPPDGRHDPLPILKMRRHRVIQ
jgi:hypothetical protein